MMTLLPHRRGLEPFNLQHAAGAKLRSDARLWRAVSLGSRVHVMRGWQNIRVLVQTGTSESGPLLVG